MPDFVPSDESEVERLNRLIAEALATMTIDEIREIASQIEQRLPPKQ